MSSCHKSLGGHQHLEVEVHAWPWRQGVRFFEITCGTTLRQDHPGCDLSCTVLNLFFQIQIYDDRHCNRDADRLMTAAEHQAEADAYQEDGSP